MAPAPTMAYRLGCVMSRVTSGAFPTNAAPRAADGDLYFATLRSPIHIRARPIEQRQCVTPVARLPGEHRVRRLRADMRGSTAARPLATKQSFTVPAEPGAIS